VEEHIVKVVRLDKSRRKWKEDRRTAERVLKERRSRYANDPDYAESIKESVRQQRGAKVPSTRKRSFNRDKILTVNGVSVSLLSSGKAGAILGVSPRTISHWEKKGYIPLNTVKDSLGRRWYPVEFVAFLAEWTVNRPSNRLDEWSSRVKEAWQTIQLGDHPIPIVGDS